jgi:hypothetical protein
MTLFIMINHVLWLSVARRMKPKVRKYFIIHLFGSKFIFIFFFVFVFVGYLTMISASQVHSVGSKYSTVIQIYSF